MSGFVAWFTAVDFIQWSALFALLVGTVMFLQWMHGDFDPEEDE